ncbi:MAG: hypothetical protein Q8L14_36335 [Myxococcales bacterium]|nr:hypothetical protein [Myxococcales bacterium]
MRLAGVLLVLVSVGALAAPRTSAPRKWKCTWQGRVVFCDLAGRPLTSPGKDGVRLFDRTPPELSSLVVTPVSFEPFAERLSGQ